MPVPTPTFPDPKEHAAAILEALQGDYQRALDYLPVYRDEFGENICAPVGRAPDATRGVLIQAGCP
jgi:hypothetical protein